MPSVPETPKPLASRGGIEASTTPPGTEFFPRGRPWKEIDGLAHLTGMRCPGCGTRAFPVREICHQCGNQEGLEQVDLSANGRLYTFSEVHVAPKGFATPYVIGYVDLDDGVRLFGQVEGTAASLAVDQPVQVVTGVIRTRPDGTKVVSYKFRGQKR